MAVGWWWAWTTVLLMTASVVPAEPVVERFSLAVGANDGGRGRISLHYAVDDAEAWNSVMGELGGVEHRVSMAQPSIEDIRAAMQDVGKQIAKARAAGHDTEFIFYYSGHAHNRGLVLGPAYYPYPTLLADAAAVQASVHVLIIDACASGSLSRLKGGTVAPRITSNISLPVRGHAFLMSASEHEAAQESDAIGGSYFTHYLLAGLRGAADADGDLVISLDEAYRFAAHETLLRTIRTMGGPQHPTYDFALNGQESFALTDLHHRDSLLRLPAAMLGRTFIYDSDGHLQVELHKEHGPTALAMPAGRYAIFVTDGDSLWQSSVNLAQAQTTHFNITDLVSVTREQALQRGAVAAATSDDLEDIDLASTGLVLRLGAGFSLMSINAFTTGNNFGVLVPSVDWGPTDDNLALTLHGFVGLHTNGGMGNPPGTILVWLGPSLLYWPRERIFFGMGVGITTLTIIGPGVPLSDSASGVKIDNGSYAGMGVMARATRQGRAWRQHGAARGKLPPVSCAHRALNVRLMRAGPGGGRAGAHGAQAGRRERQRQPGKPGHRQHAAAGGPHAAAEAPLP